MTEIILKDNFRDIHPEMDIRECGIKLLSVDVVDVITDSESPEVLPGVADHAEELLAVTEIALGTNKRDETFLDEVVSQLPGQINYVHPDKELGLKKKPSQSMFQFLIHEMYPGIEPEQAAHVDDQLKAWLGVKRASFGTFFWTKPAGEQHHRRVKAFRPIESGLIRPVISAKRHVRKQNGK